MHFLHYLFSPHPLTIAADLVFMAGYCLLPIVYPNHRFQDKK